MNSARALFSSQCVTDPETEAQIAATWETCEYLLDPHTAIGVKAALEAGLPAEVPVITLATAHPAKFPAAVRSAGVDREPALPLHLEDLFDRPERFEVLANDLSTVQQFMAGHINA